MARVSVALAERSYTIATAQEESGTLAQFLKECRPKASTVYLVGDTNVELHVRRIRGTLESGGYICHTSLIPAGEASKNLFTAGFLYDHLAEANADRQTVVVAIGGGVVGDVAGFLAATYNRGLPLFMVPTTLLAMVDSSVGGKVGINHSKGKNLIGAFHQPCGVWLDVELLNTLPQREYISGFAEVIKYGFILDAAFVEHLDANCEAMLQRDQSHLTRVVQHCCALKASVVQHDEREETGLRAILNFGHTFAHAFETVSGYGTWLHGEAVAAGMVCAARLAEKLGRVSSEFTSRLVKILAAFQLPIAPLPAWDVERLIAVMSLDKKTVAGRLRFVLPTRLGRCELVDDVPESLVRDTLRTD